ncbi:MAG: Uncharacterised protein [Bacteroidetes bacterium MED-G17]|nr:MAG: Uncharacterised protein [Bacteroidetes bacterium MED-G17]
MFSKTMNAKFGFQFEKKVFFKSLRLLFNFRRSFVIAKHELVLLFGNTSFGALWQPISLSVTIFGIGVIFGNLFDLPVERYVPFLCIGMVLWQFLTSVLNEAAACYVIGGSHINTRYDEMIIFPIKIWAKHTAQLLLNFIVVVGVFLIFHITVDFKNALLFIAGLLNFLIVHLFLSVLFSLIGAIFKDFVNVVRNILQLMFFITPIMWEPSGIEYHFLFFLNPLYHLIEMVRAPLLNQVMVIDDFYVIYAVITIALSGAILFCWSGLVWIVSYKS